MRVVEEESGSSRECHQSRWLNLALNVGAIAGVICILLVALSIFFGITPLIIRSGSMAPEITKGSLALARTVDSSDVRAGDVITVQGHQGTSITHRVVSISDAGEGAENVVLKGDANPIEDPAPYVITDVPRVFAHVPTLGLVATWLSSKTATFLAGLLAGSLLVLAFGPSRASEDADREYGG